MKTVLKSVVAIVIIAGLVAACTIKSETTTVQKEIAPEDTTATPVSGIDTTVVSGDPDKAQE